MPTIRDEGTLMPYSDPKIPKGENTMDIDLSYLNSAYLSANMVGMPNGVYRATLSDVKVEPSKADNPQIVWNFDVTTPSNGRVVTIKKFSPLMEYTMYWTRLDLEKFDIVLTEMNELHKSLKRLIGAVVDIEIKADMEGYSIDIVSVISH